MVIQADEIIGCIGLKRGLDASFYLSPDGAAACRVCATARLMRHSAH